jgi:pimeloyl-ACP methyl ester carboxylesterase
MNSGQPRMRDMEFPAYHPFRSEKAKERYLSLYDMRAKQWPVASESVMVNTSWGRTFVRISGPDGAPPLVLLPGAATSSLMWIPNIRALSESYRTYAVDNIYDFGRSVYTRPVRNAEDFVSWLDELFSVLELGDSINLMGMSYGGWLASQYALRFPNRLEKIVLLAPARTVLQFNLGFMLRVILVALPYRWAVRKFMYWIFAGLTRKDDAALASLENAVDDIFTGFRCFKLKRFVQPTVLKDKELRKIRTPALYVVGEHERIYSALKAVRRLNKVTPHIKTEVIPDAGHALTVEQTELVDEKILGFLKL